MLSQCEVLPVTGDDVVELVWRGWDAMAAERCRLP
jgi:hypothetical protein